MSTEPDTTDPDTAPTQRTRIVVGVVPDQPAEVVDRLAEEVDAAMIVVGVRKSGLRGSLHEFFNGSVAIQLAHYQPRPLVVVPLQTAGRP